MRDQQNVARADEDRLKERHSRPAKEYPIREYVGAMAAELAQMARWEGDEQLGCLLDAAAEAARRSPVK